MRRAALTLTLLLFLLPLLSPVIYADAATPIVVVDSFGRVVKIPEKPMRIVSLAPSITETLFAMGVGDRVIGVTSFCNYPPQVPQLVKEGKIAVVGGFTNPSLEKIVALEPDLVFAHNLLSPDFVKKLEDLGIPVVVIKTPESIDEVYQTILLIGRACGEDEKAVALVESLILKIQEWKQRVSGAEIIDAAYVVSYAPIWIAGSGTYIDELIRLADGRNAFSDKSWWTSISEEELVAKDPRILIVSDEHVYEALKDLKSKGLIHGEIRLISPDPIARPGPRIINALEELVKAIHPEIWAKTIEVLSLKAPSKAEPGETLTIMLQVRNPGVVEGVKAIELRFGESVYAKNVSLKPGEVKTVIFKVSAERPGAYLIEAGGRYTLCQVEKPSGEEVKLIQQSLLSELSKLKTSQESLQAQLNQLASSISEENIALKSSVSDLKSLVLAALVMSLISVILIVAVGGLVIKLRRSREAGG